MRNRLILFFILVLCSCKPKTSNDKKIFKYNESSGITSLDPLKATNISNIWAVQQIYESLFYIDSVGKVQPQLVDSFHLSNNQLYLKIKEEVLFHDNPCFESHERRLTENDVIYSLQRVNDNKPTQWMVEDLKKDEEGKISCSVLKDNVLIINTKSNSYAIIQKLANPACAILPIEAVEKYGNDFRSNPVGTGPFKFHKWYENEKLILHKNENYHEKGFPKIDGISISFLKDKQTALLEFLRGNFHFISGLDAAYKDELLTNEGKLKAKHEKEFYIHRSPYLNTEYLGIKVDSVANNPLHNVHLRKALSYGINRIKLIQYIRNGIGIPGHHGIVPPVLNPNFITKGYQFDKNKFEDELKLAGYQSADEVPTIVLNIDNAYADIGTFIINEWNQLGLHIQLNILDRPTLKSSLAKSSLVFFRASWIADYPNPENYLMLFKSDLKSPKGPNYTHYSNLKYDQLLNENSNDSLMDKHYAIVDSTLMQDAPIIILYYDEVIRFLNKKVKDLPRHPMNYLYLKYIRIE